MALIGFLFLCHVWMCMNCVNGHEKKDKNAPVKGFPIYDALSQRQLSDNLLNDFRSSIVGAVFSGVFTNNTVLQQEPQIAAIYGASDSSNVEINFQILDENSDYYDNINTMTDGLNNWKIFLSKPFPAGGNYTLSIKCAQCAYNNNTEIKLYNITFGDVFYCAGQSNMQLEMHYTFSRNETYEALLAGYYQNIRYMTMYSIDTSNITYVIPQTTNTQYQWVPYPTNDTLDLFSGTCWYFGQTLYDYYNITKTPIGLIDVAVGGSMIEQWIQNQTVQLYCKDSICPDGKCGGLFNGLVASYINMTIKAILWYQGENNVGGTPGSWHNNTGYGCMEPFMLNQWRDYWSIEPNTTSVDVPFGIVTLAAGTDEGHSSSMAPFRWAQTGNLDYAPNKILLNTFLALAHDLGDPWNINCYYLKPPTCQGNSPYSWNKTHYYMGPIHPRNKKPVGQRLAYAGYQRIYADSVAVHKKNNDFDDLTTGPVINGCQLNNITGLLNITFNSTFLLNGMVSVDIVPFVAWYNTSINYKNVADTSALEVYLEESKQWTTVNMSYISKDSSASNNINVDIGNFLRANYTVTSMRYAWATYPCCGSLDRNYNPCPSNSCPFQAKSLYGNFSLPAVPFWTDIVNNTCKCKVPQTCNAFN